MKAKLETLGVDYNLVAHCNLSCHGCDHAAPLMPQKFALLVEFERDINALASVLHCGELRLVGGEPLLHPQLLSFLKVARAAKLADSVKVYTNALRLASMPTAFWELVDILWVSLYPGVKLPMSLDEIAKRAREHDVVLQVVPLDHFTVTLLNQKIDEPELVKAIFDSCDLSKAETWCCHSVHEGRYYKCCVAPLMSQRLAMRGIALDNQKADSVSLHGNPNLRDELERYLGSRKPLMACSYCLANQGPAYPQHQLKGNQVTQWLAEDHSGAIATTRNKLLPTLLE